MAFPSTIDSYSPSSGTSLLTSPDHSGQHNQAGSAFVALENKLGLNAGSAANNQLLVGVGAGSTSWGTAWNGGNIGSATIGTPLLTGGTYTNLTIGTSPIVKLGSDAAGDTYYNNGTNLVRLGIGGNNQVLTTNGTLPSWGNSAGTLTSKLLSTTRDLSLTTGTIAYTGVGFKPSSLEAYYAQSGGGTTFMGMGFSDSGTAQMQIHQSFNGNADVTTSALIFIDSNSGAQVSGVISSYDSDGFTLIWTKVQGSPIGTITVIFRCLR